jgi:hypothetical protein
MELNPEAKKQLANSEFLIDYEYADINTYAFVSGFVPISINYLKCVHLEFISKNLA